MVNYSPLAAKKERSLIIDAYYKEKREVVVRDSYEHSTVS